MRIAQVSGHYPPNFVSGGTLVPQRIARAVAAAGHESFVFAGCLDPQRAALSVHSEVDGVGVQVTWINTTPWTAWADERNFNNVEAVAVFSEWLSTVQPDVVHVHSVQTIGGGVIPAAKAVGAKVVVTMHDFWWYCSRQFLVDRDLRPCSLVVSCGECECQAGREHLERRTSLLGSFLASADVVLAPSTIFRDALVANGLPSEDVRVDENGLPDEQFERSRMRSLPGIRRDVVRLMFAGGDQPLKGPDVLVAALAELDGVIDGLCFSLYGLNHEQAARLPTWAIAKPPFTHEELTKIFQEHDVLVLPSIARESHSILTREALAAGLAVVCTDTLGPEEAVHHGFNGLVVPAADSGALADAIRRLRTEEGLLESLVGRGPASPIRRFSEQAKGLLDLYSSLKTETVSEEVPDGGMRPITEITSVLFVVGIQGAPLRYRAHLPAEALRLRGKSVLIRHYRAPDLPTLALQADAVVFYRVPATAQVMSTIASVRERRPLTPLLFDVDDLIFDPSLDDSMENLENLTKAERDLWWRGVARYRTTMESCDMFVGSTSELCREATSLTGLPSRRFDNGVGILLARQSEREIRRGRKPGRLRVGYFSGTSTHDADWAVAEPAIIEMLERRKDVEVWLGGHLNPSQALEQFSESVVRMPLVPWYELPAILRDTDVCLAPLTLGNKFNEAKSAIKWVEAALVGTPTIATPTQPFREVIENGRTGILASTKDDWTSALDRLLDSEAERRRIGSQARREALLKLSPHTQGRAYERILAEASLQLRNAGPRHSSWEPVMDDEPYSQHAAAVEDYSMPDGHQFDRTPTPHVRTASFARLCEVWVSEGPAGVVRRGLSRLRTEMVVARSRMSHRIRGLRRS